MKTEPTTSVLLRHLPWWVSPVHMLSDNQICEQMEDGLVCIWRERGKHAKVSSNELNL